jgi:tellurite resistance protein TerC
MMSGMDFGALWMGHPLWMWVSFGAIVAAIMAFDLGLFHRKDHEMGLKESLRMSGLYAALALVFGAWVFFSVGPNAGQDFLTGYVIEYSLSMDNIFVMSLIFAYLGIPRAHQHRVLFWGILGVLILRGVLIIAGAALIERFEWILYLFGVFLIYSGIHMGEAPQKEEKMDVASSPVLKFLRGHFRISEELHGQRFFVNLPSSTGKLCRHLTPLMVALILIELADVVFALDSVPAIFAITRDAYVVFTSNIFAVLGLRALYFALSALVDKFVYLKKALALVLVFIGFKIFVPGVLKLEPVPSGVSLGITVAILAWGVVWSLYRTKHPKVKELSK